VSYFNYLLKKAYKLNAVVLYIYSFFTDQLVFFKILVNKNFIFIENLKDKNFIFVAKMSLHQMRITQIKVIEIRIALFDLK